MANDWFTENAPKQGGEDWFSVNAPKSAAPTHPLARLGTGVQSGLGDVVQMVRHPINTVVGMGTGIKEAAKAVPDVARLLMDPETRGATAKGFVKGGIEGAAGVDAETAAKDPLNAVGRFIGGVVIPSVALKGGGKVVGKLRAKGVPAAAVEAAAAAPEVAAETPKPTGRLVVNAERPAQAPPNTNVEKAISEALGELTAKPEPMKAPQLPASWNQYVRETPRGATVAARHLPEGKPTGRLARLMRDEASLGPDKSARAAVQAELEARGVNTKLSAEDVRKNQEAYGQAAAPGTRQARQGEHVQDALRDAEYRFMLANERGAIDPKLLATLGAAGVGGAGLAAIAAQNEGSNPLGAGIVGALGGAAAANPMKALEAIQALRMTGMLSGAALPKSVAGNAGSFLTAAAEQGSMAPLREAFRIPTNAKVALQAFKQGANPSQVGAQSHVSKINVPGRLMGAMDEASTQALQRAGLPLEEAQRLLLTNPKVMISGSLHEKMQTPVGRFFFPFQRTPMNAAAEGMQSIMDLAPGSGASNARRALTIGAGATGAAAGSETDNPLALGLLAALAGPRALPFALGAAAGVGGSSYDKAKLLERIGPGLPAGSYSDTFDPVRSIDEPAILRFLEQLAGQE